MGSGGVFNLQWTPPLKNSLFGSVRYVCWECDPLRQVIIHSCVSFRGDLSNAILWRHDQSIFLWALIPSQVNKLAAVCRSSLWWRVSDKTNGAELAVCMDVCKAIIFGIMYLGNIMFLILHIWKGSIHLSLSRQIPKRQSNLSQIIVFHFV